MLRQIRLLSKLQICNLFNLNEIRHTKDSKKKHRFVGMAIVWGMLILMLIFYMVILCSAFVTMGMADVIPMYLYMITSLVILFFSFFKASHMIFQMDSFEMQISLPVSRSAIVISRFLSMYVTNMALGFLVMIPGMVIYGIGVKPGFGFYIYMLLGTIFLPLLPMTVSTAIGAGITAISARMKHKNLASSVLTILFAVVTVVGSMALSGGATNITEEMVMNLAGIMTEQISRTYPPAAWFGNAAVHGNLIQFLILLGLSMVIFAAMVAVLQRYFLTICNALNATSAKNNYKMQSLSVGSPVKALWKKELKRYFACSVYVSNTMIGYILMTILAVAVCVVGADKVEEMMQLPHIIQRALPMALAAVAGMMPITSCSISLEGKHWWMLQTLPVSAKTVFDSKILVNLAVAAPFYLVSVIAGAIAQRADFMGVLWLALIPGIYIVFTSVLGITINLMFPVLEWEAEVRVVKQSASTMVTMLAGTICCIPTFVCVLAMGTVAVNVVYGVTVVVFAALTVVLYVRNNSVKLRDVG